MRNTYWSLVMGLLVVGIMPVRAEEKPSPGGADAADRAALAKRLAAVEAKLGLIEKKLRLLGAESEAELTGLDAVFGDPKLLLAQANRAAFQDRAPERAYQYVSAVRSLFPKSAEDREAFRLAAALFKALHFRYRHDGADSPWNTIEPLFMFQWLADAFPPEGGAFPQEAVEQLLQGAPVGLVRDFEAFAANRPRLARWKIVFSRDNGLVESISATESNVTPPSVAR